MPTKRTLSKAKPYDLPYKPMSMSRFDGKTRRVLERNLLQVGYSESYNQFVALSISKGLPGVMVPYGGKHYHKSLIRLLALIIQAAD